MPSRPNVLFIMTDQQRFDTISALNNDDIYTPNLDRLTRRGLTFTHAMGDLSRSRARRRPWKGVVGTIWRGRCTSWATGRSASASSIRSPGMRTWVTKSTSTLHSEELYGNPDQRGRDAYAGWIAKEHPEFDYIEALMGERTEMYYMPQVSPMPAEITVERWAADRAVEQLNVDDVRPYFGFVSFIGPHPPFAPPVPFNRMYDPDRMPTPVRGDRETDQMDEQIPWMNYLIWADDVSDARATVICFFADHGDHLGDHHAWQKESFFEQSTHVPFLVSWPVGLPDGPIRDRDPRGRGDRDTRRSRCPGCGGRRSGATPLCHGNVWRARHAAVQGDDPG